MSLSRRSFVRRLSALTALGFAMAARPLAAAAVGEEPQLWSRQALPLGLPIAEPLIDHPFVRGFALGTLPLEQALVYMDQSIPYLSNYAECFALFEGILTESEDKALARRWRDETVAALEWNHGLREKLSGGKRKATDKITPLSATVRYMKLERDSVLSGSPAVGMAALLPCFWVYGVVGKGIAKIRRLENNPYAEWVSAYGSAEYEKNVASAVGLADRLAAKASDEERRKATEPFLEGCRLEKAFFDAPLGR